MEIRNIFIRKTIVVPEQPVLLQKGETYEAMIKESKDGEAVVNIKGTEVRFRTEGEWPKEGRVTIEIIDEQGELPAARIVSHSQEEAATAERAAHPVAAEPLPAELKQVESWLRMQGQPLTKEMVSTLKTFFVEAPGTIEQKLDTIRALVNKKLELTNTQLAAVHEALHGKPLGERLAAIANELDPAFTFANQREQSTATETVLHRPSSTAGDLLEQAQTPMGNASGRPVSQALLGETEPQQQGRESEARVRLNQALMQAEQELRVSETGNLAKEGRRQSSLAEQIREIRTQVARTPDLSKALAQVREQLAKNDHVPADVRRKVEAVLKETAWLQQIGQHTLAKNHLVRQLAQIEQTAAAASQHSPLHSVQTVPPMNQTAVPSETMEGASRGGCQLLPAAQPLGQAVPEAAPMDLTERELLHVSSAANSQSGAIGKAAELEQWIERMHEAVRYAIKVFQHEPHLEKAFDAVQTDIREAFRAAPHWIQKLDGSLAKARELNEKGRELAARQTVLRTLNEIEASLSSTLNDRLTNIDSLFDGAWQAGLPLQAKDFIVQTVTKKMAQAAMDFKNVKRDIMRHLETVLQLTENGKQGVRLQGKQLLETAIKQLDNAILKSDIMLFTDMAMEKQLMKASSQLAEAKKRLYQGDERGARKIVSEVKDMLANMAFKPSDVRVKHFIAKEGLTFADPSKEFLARMNEAVQPLYSESSARQLFETLRRLGLTHDYEVAESLVFKGNREEVTPPNMKAALLRLVQSGNEQIAQQAEQALNQLTGQQLLNKWDAGAGTQSFFFSLPMLWQNELRNVKVYVNARQDGERIDWENCRLYFLFETKKLGDVGILLSANERNLSIMLRNDRDDFGEKVRPLVDMAKERLEEIGYRIVGMNVTKLTREPEPKEEKQSNPPMRPYASWTERGYDFTI
ncbi:hypothetical protein A5N86_10610 [Geobacillus thermoleovorans]|uniref:hypothetical protein n=1 Tax=Geobacillus thermoleovorans TaxID=33941 RepID=UPI00083BA155|nr:hypothetical protein [Geobacillus thermoleovorans]ODA17121.1 hypothetical protein A5N86_10610 [Geobacillus thermoleovorans]